MGKFMQVHQVIGYVKFLILQFEVTILFFQKVT